MRISDWSSDVCSSDLTGRAQGEAALGAGRRHRHRPAAVGLTEHHAAGDGVVGELSTVEEHLGEALVAVEAPEATDGHARRVERHEEVGQTAVAVAVGVGAEQAEQVGAERAPGGPGRTEEPTYELQSLMRNSYAVFC